MWCTAPDCSFIIYLHHLTNNDKRPKNIRCTCGNYFCLAVKNFFFLGVLNPFIFIFLV